MTQETKVGDCYVRRLNGQTFPTWQISHESGRVIATCFTEGSAVKIAEAFSHKAREQTVTGSYEPVTQSAGYVHFDDDTLAPAWPNGAKVKLTLLAKD